MNKGRQNDGLNDKKQHAAVSSIFESQEYEKILPLIPLIKVAWAEGRITNRERQIIFDAAERSGITPECASYQKLADWLELHPTDDFYNESLEYLSAAWQKMSAEDRSLKRLEILSDCALIAEASGGTGKFAAGGPRICPEEFDAVKRIAEKLSPSAATI